MTNRETIKSLALAAYCEQFNATSDDDQFITPADCESPASPLIITPLDADDIEHANSFRIQITNDECAIDILALRITITDDRFATDAERFTFFLSIDTCPYIPLP